MIHIDTNRPYPLNIDFTFNYCRSKQCHFTICLLSKSLLAHCLFLRLSSKMRLHLKAAYLKQAGCTCYTKILLFVIFYQGSIHIFKALQSSILKTTNALTVSNIADRDRLHFTKTNRFFLTDLVNTARDKNNYKRKQKTKDLKKILYIVSPWNCLLINAAQHFSLTMSDQC